MNAIVVTIGDEILIGQIIDTNSTWLATELHSLDIQVVKMISIPDTKEAIVHTLAQATEQVDLVITTGGLGATKDDITKKSIASFLGLEMYFDEGVHEHITALYKKFNRTLTDTIRAQCYMPEGVQVLKNIMGTAPGMLFRHRKSCIVSMPGVPYEMKWIFEHSLVPELMKNKSDIFLKHLTIRTIGMGETTIADKIEDITDSFPDNISIAFLPSLGTVRLRLSGRGRDEQQLESQLQSYSEKIVFRLSDIVFGYGRQTLAQALQEKYVAKSITVGTAESCTGGNISRTITSAPGASAYYMGSVVAYDYNLKTSLLNVSEEILNTYGAVSEETVVAMVKGGLKLLKTEVVVAVSGIAGPAGGTPDKPVGTIWLACGDKNKIQTKKLQLSKDRDKNIIYTTNVALNMLRKYIDAE
jgi:nicotinamide-nucleotide amidase